MVKKVDFGRSTYRVRKRQNIGKYKEPQLISYGRGLYEQDYGCPPKQSTAIESIGYNSSLGRLTVTFTGGRSYNYDGVSLQRYQAFCTSQSWGKYVNSSIKGQYAYTRIG